MKKDVINLYVSSDGCPKCSVLIKRCEDSVKIKDSDFQIICVDPSDKDDTNLQLLLENNMLTFPVLLVNDEFMDFGQAMRYI